MADDDKKQEPVVKPGVKSSEFWSTMLVQVLATAVIAFGMWKGSDGILAFGAILSGVAQGSYNVSRGLEKGGAAKALGQILAATATTKPAEGEK